MTAPSAATRLHTPLSDADVLRLNVGDQVLLSGVVYTARDAAHQRMGLSLLLQNQ